MSFRVNAKQCSTCIFGRHTPISEDRFEELVQVWNEIEAELHRSDVKIYPCGCCITYFHKDTLKMSGNYCDEMKKLRSEGFRANYYLQHDWPGLNAEEAWSKVWEHLGGQTYR